MPQILNVVDFSTSDIRTDLSTVKFMVVSKDVSLEGRKGLKCGKNWDSMKDLRIFGRWSMRKKRLVMGMFFTFN